MPKAKEIEVIVMWQMAIMRVYLIGRRYWRRFLRITQVEPIERRREQLTMVSRIPQKAELSIDNYNLSVVYLALDIHMKYGIRSGLRYFYQIVAELTHKLILIN